MLSLLVALATPHERRTTAPVPERRVLLPFDYRSTRLTGGILYKQLEETKEFYLRIPNDDLLLGFRRRAGKPAPGVELGGWYSEDTFSIFGQILSGLSRIYAATGDEDCREKAMALYRGWRECIAPDGYFYYSNKPNVYHYTYDKMVGGLVDMATYLHEPEVLTDLARITRWAEKHLDRTRPYGADGAEWYTLSENLYRAYLLTGDTRYRDFAKVWEYTPYWKCYADNRSIFSVKPWMGKPTGSGLPAPVNPKNQEDNIGYHAYSHINTLGGAALAYRVTGQPWYLDSIRNAYDFMQSRECFATGGYGPDEGLVNTDELLRRLDRTTATFETQCGAWAIFKLCKNLIAITGDAKYGDWVEKAMYNGIAATITETPTGKVFYYSDYNPNGGIKVNNWTEWTCCAGTRPMAIADVSDLTYFQAPDGVNVNLFVPSRAGFLVGTEHVEVEQSTDMPEQGYTHFSIYPSAPVNFALRLRAPSWLSGHPSIKVNQKPVSYTVDTKHWITIRRKWKWGDGVNVTLPMALHSVPLVAGKKYPTAVADGPVVLAFRTLGTNPVAKVDLAGLSSQLMPSPGEPLNFHLKNDPRILVRPFYEFKEGEQYFMYLDPSAAGRVTYHRMRRQGAWRDSGIHFFSNEVGAWCEGDFDGPSVELIGWKYDDGGRAEIKIDGKVVGKIDQYGPGRDLPFKYRLDHLGTGKHTIRITVLSDADPASKDHYINVGGLKV